MNFINPAITDLQQLAKDKQQEYLNAVPFPSITFDNFFDQDVLDKIVGEFPDLSKQANVFKFNNPNEKKLATKGESLFGEMTKSLAHYLNSQPMLEFLQELTGIQETLLPDPYFFGGGYHEIKPGGLLKVHADFNKHTTAGIDRRINLLVYLNKDWEESYGGHFELWDKDLKKAHAKILPLFNRIAIFSTTDFSYHGHPDPLTCPPDRSRRSLAFYYYSNGRPKEEISEEEHTTLFVNREGVKNDTAKIKDPATLKSVIRDLTPPILYEAAKRILNK
jgi:Rps23 Pro-64 3,4-dihydroxylase Tpa1-like proline 4-hydroxylase